MSYLLPGVDFMLMYTSFEVSLHYNDTWYEYKKRWNADFYAHKVTRMFPFWDIQRMCVDEIGISHFLH